MTGSAGIRVDGARQLRKTLRAAGDDLADLKRAHGEAAEIAARASAALAPSRTGRLKASIRAGATKTAGVVRAGKKAVPYAAPIHWGWFKRGIRPNAFISRGAQDSEGKWIGVYTEAVDRALSQIEGA